MGSDFLQRIKNDVLVAYAPMGTLLVEEYGKPMEQHLSEWVLDNPEKFQEAVRRSYDAGCDMTHCATQASSPFRSKPYGEATLKRVREFNYKSAKLAREVTPKGRYVIGNISTSNPDFLEPVGNMTYNEVYEGYKAQIIPLAEGGVDVFHIAGSHIDECLIGIKVAKDHTDIPVIGQDIFYAKKQGFRSLMGNDPATVAAKLEAGGADVVGTNCGLMTKSTDPSVWYSSATVLIRELGKGCHRPLCFQPDAGLAQLVNGKTIYPAKPEDMAAAVLDWIEAGARLVGGCCGTSLEHYTKISAVIKAWRARNA